jgi:hypothetical protein
MRSDDLRAIAACAWLLGIVMLIVCCSVKTNGLQEIITFAAFAVAVCVSLSISYVSSQEDTEREAAFKKAEEKAKKEEERGTALARQAVLEQQQEAARALMLRREEARIVQEQETHALVVRQQQVREADEQRAKERQAFAEVMHAFNSGPTTKVSATISGEVDGKTFTITREYNAEDQARADAIRDAGKRLSSDDW